MDNQLEYCMKCGSMNSDNKDKCECGCTGFVFGSDFKYEDRQVTCGCGNNTFVMVSHVNMSPYHTKSYSCGECGNVIVVQTYSKLYDID